MIEKYELLKDIIKNYWGYVLFISGYIFLLGFLGIFISPFFSIFYEWLTKKNAWGLLSMILGSTIKVLESYKLLLVGICGILIFFAGMFIFALLFIFMDWILPLLAS
jgi:hypothetical protein